MIMRVSTVLPWKLHFRPIWHFHQEMLRWDILRRLSEMFSWFKIWKLGSWEAKNLFKCLPLACVCPNNRVLPVLVVGKNGAFNMKAFYCNLASRISLQRNLEPNCIACLHAKQLVAKIWLLTTWERGKIFS